MSLKSIPENSDHYLINTPIPCHEINFLNQLKERGYLEINYNWKEKCNLYIFCQYQSLPKDSFICNLLYFEAFQSTLFQFASPLLKKFDFYHLPLFWFRGKVLGFQIGDQIYGEYFILQSQEKTSFRYYFLQSLQFEKRLLKTPFLFKKK